MSDKQSARYGRQMSRDLKDFFRSVRLGDVSSIRHSIEGQGINVNTTDAWDNTPLYLACLCGHLSAVKYLLQKGARYDTNSVDSQRCFLSSLTNDIRQVLKQYECSLIVESTDLKYVEYLQQLYERQPGYDIELEIQGQLYLAHRCILSVRCRYFADQFRNNTNGRIALSHKLMCTDVFGPMLRFIYTGRLDIEKRQREKAIALAKFLQFNSLAEILVKDKSLLMICHQQLLKDLKKDFGCLVTAAVSPSVAAPAENEACGLDIKTYPDIIFDVQGHSFKCHKIFFYGRSEFFREMLIDKEDEQPPAYGDYLPSIKLDDITADAFVQIISFLYIEEYEVTKDTCIPLMRASTQFVLPVIKKKCSEEISKYIYPSNVLDIYQTSVELDMPRLINSCTKYMADEYEQMITFPEFEMFIRQQLSPLMNEGTAFDQIPFFMDFQYYLRHECSTWEEQRAANEKLQKLNYLLTHRIGLDVSIPLFQVGHTRPEPVIIVGHQVLSKQEVRQRMENEEQKRREEEEKKNRKKIEEEVRRRKENEELKRRQEEDNKHRKQIVPLSQDKQSARYGRQMSQDLKDFFRSVRLGDVSAIRHSIEGQGINVNTTDAWDNTPLYLACLCGHLSAVKYLLKNGARYDTNSVDSQRCFLSSLTNDIRQVLKQYECSLIVESTDLKYVDYLQQLYERQPGYDIELEIQGQLYLAHRCILSARCRYFADRFRKKNTNGRIAITHKLMCTDVFGPMLRFIYTGRLDIEKRQRARAIALAKFLQFNSLAEILEKDQSLHSIQHQQLLKDLKKDFGCLVTAAVSPSVAAPAENEACGLDVKTYPDIIFDVQGHLFKCHKIFFYGRSEFFREMLIDKEDEQPPVYGDYLPSIKLDDMTADVFVQIISFLYIEEYEVTKDTCIPLMRASTQFVLPVIKKKCSEEISKYIYPSNVLDIYQTSVELDMPRLINSCTKYMADEYEQMISFPEFEMFIRQQLSPLMKEGTAFDQIPFFMDFQYYLRHECSTWEEQKAANEKLQKLNYLLTHRIGLDVIIPLFQVSHTRPEPVIISGRQVLSKEEVRNRMEHEEGKRRQEEDKKNRIQSVALIQPVIISGQQNLSIEEDRQRGENEELRSIQKEDKKHRKKGNRNTSCFDRRNPKSCIIL
ncbi:uncharacterized protein LOC127706000 [Mytilus californianus]|uniref:uncharacterized protein LOC127706000 n=1 Tax=Mytilus californianus TaxID=6549 RepID=UPI00224708C0|nr:uncharacterized protein LOC127706000 [Mytilus californianus]